MLPSGALSTSIKASSAPVTITVASSAPATITESGTTIISAPAPTTAPSLICPAANGSTYTATKTPPPVTPVNGQHLHWQIPNATLSFEILCDTQFDAEMDSSVTDIQIYPNVSSLSDCLDECALYNFRAASASFPSWGCTGVTLGIGNDLPAYLYNTCWLQNNVTLSTRNYDANKKPECDAAVLLNSGLG